MDIHIHGKPAYSDANIMEAIQEVYVICKLCR